MRRILWILPVFCMLSAFTPQVHADDHNRDAGGGGGGGNPGRMDGGGGGGGGGDAGRMDGGGGGGGGGDAGRMDGGGGGGGGDVGHMDSGNGDAGHVGGAMGGSADAGAMPRHRHRHRTAGSGGFAGGAPNARLSQMGVTRMPTRLSSGRQLSAAFRGHSSAPNPGTGFDGRALGGQALGRASWSGPTVRGQMNFISTRGNGFTRAALAPMFLMDRARNHYYWHQDGGFNYCFYRDSYGCDWFGWYIGPDFFWTQYYRGTWWIYDDVENRWCYWADGNWWWQDPDDPEMVYLFENGDYIPAD